MTKVVNIIAGPCAGKSTTAAGVFNRLKVKGVNCELVTEFAKDLVWQENIATLERDQLYVSGVQYHRENMLLGKVDYVITDSPILLSPIYYKDDDLEFKKLYEDFFVGLFKKRDNITIFLERPLNYVIEGRAHTAQQSEKIDREIVALLGRHQIPFHIVEINENVVDNILNIIGA